LLILLVNWEKNGGNYQQKRKSHLKHKVKKRKPSSNKKVEGLKREKKGKKLMVELQRSL